MENRQVDMEKIKLFGDFGKNDYSYIVGIKAQLMWVKKDWMLRNWCTIIDSSSHCFVCMKRKKINEMTGEIDFNKKFLF